MNILSLYCDNIYMFKDYNLDFTYDKKINHPLAEADALFDNSKIYVRKNMVVLGGNASGKTTIGKLLCAILNYLLCRDSYNKFDFFEVRYDKNRTAVFKFEFVAGMKAYYIECQYDSNGILYEEIKHCNIFKSNNLASLREKLYNSKQRKIYRRESLLNTRPEIFLSKILVENEEFLKEFREHICFSFLFSNVSDSTFSRKIMAPVSTLKGILPKIDNSVKDVVELRSKDVKLNNPTYVILFKNGEQITIADGNLDVYAANRLSHGTIEALLFLSAMEFVKQNPGCIIFIDEQLAHLHAELEAYLVMKSFLLPHSGQVFFTTHDSELLDLNLPNTSFLIFHRNNGEFNESIYVSDRLMKNDRRIRGYYDNNYFGTVPDYSSLDEFFDEYEEGLYE